MFWLYSPLSTEIWTLAVESQFVIGLRTLKLLAGGNRAVAESQLMVSEKLRAAAALSISNSVALFTGAGIEGIAKSNVGHYQRLVRANRKRLMRGR